MRYELSLTGGTFAPAVEDFDRKLLLLLDMMRSRGLDEGDVTLKISVEMVQAHPMDEGVARDYWPHVQAEARRIWREMRAAGFLDRQENPSP